MNITIGGYYGFGNLGDEATVQMLVSDIKKEYPHAKITVLSNSAYMDARSINRNSLRQIREALSESEIFILGGGSLIQDATSVRSLFYYCELIKLAHKLNNKVCILGGGIGPLTHRDYAAETLSLCSYISVRDSESAKILEDMGIGCCICPDRVLSHPPAEYSGRGRYFTVNLRMCADGRMPRTDKIADSLYPFINEGLMPVYISMQDEYDLGVCQKAKELTGGRIVTPTSVDRLIDLQKGAKFAVGMRLHYLLSAALAGCPTLSLIYDPKCAILPFPQIDPFSFSPHEMTAFIRFLTPTPIPENAPALCREDIRKLEKITRDEAKNTVRCLK